MRKFTFCLIAMSIFIVTNAQIPTKGLIGYWPFTGDANDLSGNGNNGTVNGATLTEDRFGIPNSAYHLNGINNDISIVNSSSLNPQNAFTICAWYKSETFTGLGYSPIVDKGYTSHVSPYYEYKLGVGGSYKNQNNFAFSVTTNNFENRITTVNQFWTPGNWYFLVGTYDGSTMKLFVNNQLIQSIQVTGLISTYNTPVYFGNNTTANDFLQGVIDDIRMYNRALDSTEMTALYNEDICKVSINVKDTLYLNTILTSFNPVNYKNTIKIYPNSTNDHLIIDNGNVSILSGYQIKIINSLNQVVFQSLINTKQFNIDLSLWSGKGIYIVNLIDGNGKVMDIRKIVLQ